MESTYSWGASVEKNTGKRFSEALADTTNDLPQPDFIGMLHMQRIIKHVSVFLIIFSPGLLLILPEIQAQQAALPGAAAASSESVTIDELKTRRAAIENRKDIDAALKADSLKYLERAMVDLNLAAEFNNKTQALSDLIQTAPRRLKILRDELTKPFAALETVKERAQQLDTAALEKQLNQEKAALAEEQDKLQKWDERLTAEKNTIRQASEKLAATGGRLDEIQTELVTLTDVNADDIGNHTRMLSLKSEREKLRAQSRLNALRQQSHNLLVELFGMERDVARKAVESRSVMLTVLQAEVQIRRQQEAAQERRDIQDAQDAMGRAQTLPKVIQDQFDINIELTSELEDIIRQEADITAKYETVQARLKALEADLAAAKKRFELTKLSEAMGSALRKKRLNLPSADLYAADAKARRSEMSNISEKQIVLDQVLQELASPKALVQSLVGSVSFLSDVDRQSFDLKIQELIAKRIEILEKLKSGYNRILKLLQDIEFTTQSIIMTAHNFGELLDRHLLWTRSSKRLRPSDLLNLKQAFGWAFGPVALNQIGQDLSRSWRQHAIIWSVGIIITLALVSTRRRTHRKIDEINALVQQQPLQDSMVLTLKVLGLTVLLAVVWPFIMAFPSVVLLNMRPIELHTRATTSGLLVAAQILFIFNLLYHISCKNGLAQVHLNWAEPARQSLWRNFRWFIPIVVACHFIVAAVDSIPEIEYSDTLANFALVGLSVAVVVFFAGLLRFKGGVMSVLVHNYPESWLARLRYVWYPLLILLPLLMFYLTAEGYYYSALEIDRLISLTIFLVFGLIILYDLMLRLLMLARRQIVLKKAQMAQQLQQEKLSDIEPGSAPAATDADQASLMTSTIGQGAIDDQTRTLLKTVIFILALIGLWAIWKPLFPAFGILQNVKLWSYTSVVGGASQLRAITLADIAVTAFIIMITVIAVRNLPGLLEMILLNRLPMDPGARYAYAAICRYTLTALGIVIALNIVGIRWSSLKWLVAALSVGIGFGLQEIIANFICGLIILFERPIRVGDVVTIGTTNGVVTKIRIRATTIRDWDRKELLVPNKEFVTGRLLNWSLSDQTVRIMIVVGVAYGSDVDKALALMLEAAKEHERVLSDPEPTTSFDIFGDNALMLTLRAFIGSTDDRLPVITDLHKVINQKFAEAGIAISFPQRDVHLDASGPLEVRVVPAPSGSKTA